MSHNSPSPVRRITAVAAGVAATLALASCGISDSDADSTPAAGAVSIHNCDRNVTVAAPPERVVSLNQGTTELLLALGLGGRIVGSATWTEPVRADLAEAEAQVPRLAEGTPSFESVLATEPDFVIGLYNAIFTDDRVATRDRFAELGIPTWLSPTSCFPESKVLDEAVELDDIFGEVTDIAEIFGVPERGEQLVAELRARVDAAQSAVADLDLPEDYSALFWFGQNESPYMAGSTGAPAIMARTLGIENTYGDIDSLWPQVSWEDVLERSPDLLVMADLTREGPGQSMASKIDHITGDKAISQLPAVQSERWLPMRGTELNITISTVDGIEKLAAKLTEIHGDQ